MMGANADFTIRIDGHELANAAAQFMVAYERLGLALTSLEKATGIAFRESITTEIREAFAEKSA